MIIRTITNLETDHEPADDADVTTRFNARMHWRARRAAARMGITTNPFIYDAVEVAIRDLAVDIALLRVTLCEAK